MKKTIITIDGPAASGKEHIARYISKKYSLKHLDSGILYRKIAHLLLKKKIKLGNLNAFKRLINNSPVITYRKSKYLRSEKISKMASKIAIFKFVRNYVNKTQRDFVKNNKIYKGFVIDGRDIGSVVFKNADLKLYIEVNEQNRAQRRYKQLIDSGEKSIYQKILREIKLRDKKDKTRKISPLVIPKGAIVIDNNGSFKNTVNQIRFFLDKL